jgi:hypothetical protein
VFGVFNTHADELMRSLAEVKTIRGQIEAAQIGALHQARPPLIAFHGASVSVAQHGTAG